MKQAMMRLRRCGGGCEGGFTLLEYCAGAAVILIIIWVALQALGGSVSGLLVAVANWADKQTQEINP